MCAKHGFGVLAAIALFLAADAAAQTRVDFGDDSSVWARDGECDDPRFEGQGMAATLIDEDLKADATDCRILYERGLIRLRGTSFTGGSGNSSSSGSVDFGNNTSDWANDGECDDPRFEGQGMASVLLDEDRNRDANDCRDLYNAGMIRLRGSAGGGSRQVNSSGVDFGNNTSDWANDGECDDPRFEGRGMASVLLDEDLRRDANDCRDLYNAGMIRLRGSSAPASAPSSGSNINFGNDTSDWANDGECDDPRFIGDGMASVLLDEDLGRDATDCRNLYNRGWIRLR
ncbi:MAG: hypothetical protein QNI99_06220 [Woeseiaceae bacterium]|nr:hypothetical protein [Woeseiaceae bacterium]